MNDFENMVFHCSSAQEVIKKRNEVAIQLPTELRKKLDTVFTAYLGKYGYSGLFDRVNDRTIGQIISEYKSQEDGITMIESGEVDGVRYKLSKPTKKDEKTNEDHSVGS